MSVVIGIAMSMLLAKKRAARLGGSWFNLVQAVVLLAPYPCCRQPNGLRVLNENPNKNDDNKDEAERVVHL